MAFQTDSLAKEYNSAQQEAIRIKAGVTSASAAYKANNQSANSLIALLQQMKSAIEVWDRVAALPGIAQYARDQHDDQAYDVIAEFTAMRAAAVSVRDWVINNFPKSAGGYIEKDTLEADGAITVRVFTIAQLAPLTTEMDALVATIG